MKFSGRKPDFFVIYGQNEAGKSTLLRAISALLFGVPQRTQDVYSFKGSELRIGGVVSEGERTFSFRRRKGVTGTLLNSDDQQVPDDGLSSYLRGMDRGQFEQFFGLDHVRLRDGGEELLLGKGDVGSSLFQAAGVDLRRLLEMLGNEAKELFSPKARTRVIGTALEEYRQARAELRKSSVSAAAAKEKKDGLDEARRRNDTLNAEAESVRQSLSKLNRIAGNKPDLARLQEIRDKLMKLQSVPVIPVDSRSRRDEAVSASSEANRQIQALTIRIAQCQERIALLPLDSHLKGYAPTINELNAGVHDYLRSVSDRPKREAEYRESVRLAENEWREVWNKLPITEAEKLRVVYGQKAEIRSLITEHAGIAAAMEEGQKSLLRAQANHERLAGDLSTRPDPPDCAALIAEMERGKSLGNTNEGTARVEAEIERIGRGISREVAVLPLWNTPVWIATVTTARGSFEEPTNLQGVLLCCCCGMTMLCQR